MSNIVQTVCVDIAYVSIICKPLSFENGSALSMRIRKRKKNYSMEKNNKTCVLYRYTDIPGKNVKLYMNITTLRETLKIIIDLLSTAREKAIRTDFPPNHRETDSTFAILSYYLVYRKTFDPKTTHHDRMSLANTI